MTMTTKTMGVYDKLAKALNVELTNDYREGAMDLEIGTWNTDVYYNNGKAVIFVADFDQYLPEYEVNNYLEELEQLESFDNN
jgi:hypothetical protein